MCMCRRCRGGLRRHREGEIGVEFGDVRQAAMALASEVWDPTDFENRLGVVWEHLPAEARSSLQQASAAGVCQSALSGLAPLLFATDMWHSHRACPSGGSAGAWCRAIGLVVEDAVGPDQHRVLFELVDEHERMQGWVESSGWPLWRSALGDLALYHGCARALVRLMAEGPGGANGASGVDAAIGGATQPAASTVASTASAPTLTTSAATSVSSGWEEDGSFPLEAEAFGELAPEDDLLRQFGPLDSEDGILGVLLMGVSDADDEPDTDAASAGDAADTGTTAATTVADAASATAAANSGIPVGGTAEIIVPKDKTRLARYNRPKKRVWSQTSPEPCEKGDKTITVQRLEDGVMPPAAGQTREERRTVYSGGEPCEVYRCLGCSTTHVQRVAISTDDEKPKTQYERNRYAINRHRRRMRAFRQLCERCPHCKQTAASAAS